MLRNDSWYTRRGGRKKNSWLMYEMHLPAPIAKEKVDTTWRWRVSQYLSSRMSRDRVCQKSRFKECSERKCSLRASEIYRMGLRGQEQFIDPGRVRERGTLNELGEKKEENLIRRARPCSLEMGNTNNGTMAWGKKNNFGGSRRTWSTMTDFYLGNFFVIELAIELASTCNSFLHPRKKLHVQRTSTCSR